jgi:Uma2 family endonuclease
MNLASRFMSAEEFLDWRQNQPGRWELVSGQPIQMMAGARQRHDQIVVNLVAAFKTMLKGGPCRPWTADIATRTVRGNVRQPDVTIDRAGVRPEALGSTAPTVVFEVLSKSTRAVDQVRKLDEYKLVETMRHIVLIEPDAAKIGIWSRVGANDAWGIETVEGLEAGLNLAAVGTALALSDIYDGIEFPPAT